MRRFLFYRSQCHKLLMFNRMDEAIIEMSKSHGKWLEEDSPPPSSSADRSVKRNLAFFFNRECNNIVLLNSLSKFTLKGASNKHR
jgi:hypothetical protein